MRKRYLECGKIVTTHGVAGEVKIQPWCDGPQELLELCALYLEKGEKKYPIERARVHGGMVLAKLAGVDGMDGAALLRGRVVYLDREELALSEGEYFIQDLIGLTVADADTDEIYGTLTDVSQTGANDVYHITFPSGEVKLVPAIPEVVIATDLEENRMRIRPLEGLFDDED